MAKYIVDVPEVHIQRIAIEAESFKEALDKVYDGKGEEQGEVIYDYTLDKEEAGVWILDGNNKKDFRKGSEL